MNCPQCQYDYGDKYWGQRWKLDYLKKEWDKRHELPKKEPF